MELQLLSAWNENKIICNISSVKKCELRKAMNIYYSSNIPEKIEKEIQFNTSTGNTVNTIRRKIYPN